MFEFALTFAAGVVVGGALVYLLYRFIKAKVDEYDE